MRLLDAFAKGQGYSRPLAYFHSHWSRDAAPLLDHLGAVVDHVEAFSKGGAHEDGNFATACNKCNARKNDGRAEDFRRMKAGRPVKGKYGEPKNWDGLSAIFMVLARQPGIALNATDRRWLRALETSMRKGRIP